MINNNIHKIYTIQGKKINPESKKFGFLQFAPIKENCIRDIKLTFYENDVPASIIMAKRAVSDIPFDKDLSLDKNLAERLFQKIDFSGDIALITEDKRTLTCKSLRWDSKQERIFASGDCILRYEGKFVKADLIDTDVNLRGSSFRNDKEKRLKKLVKIF